MLSPEVWHFSPPRIRKECFSDITEDKVTKHISQDTFYHNIFLLCANTSKDIPVEIDNAFKECIYYKLSNISLRELFERDFIQGYIKKGSTHCLSIDVDANNDNIVSIRGSGDFSLILNADSYHKFGINGEKLKKKSNQLSFYINLDLSSNDLNSNTKLYKRLYQQSKHINDFTLVISWEPDDKETCPSSIAKYFVSRGITVEECEPSVSIKKRHASFIPSPDVKHVDNIVEWMGMIAVGGDLCPEEDYVSAYSNKFDKAASEGFVVALHVNGFFTSTFVDELQKLLRELLHRKNICQWYGLSTQTFTDAPKKEWLNEGKCLPQDDVVTLLCSNERSIFTKCTRLY